MEVSARSDVSLLDVLRELSVSAQDALVDRLRVANCISAARQTCKALKQFIDGGIRELTITLRNELQELPRLELFPRCTHLEVATPHDEEWEAGAITVMVMLCAHSWPAGARERVTSLAVDPRICKRDDAAAAISCLLREFSGLSALDLGWYSPHLHDPWQRQLVIRAVASLRRLVRLRFPGFRSAPPCFHLTDVELGSLLDHLPHSLQQLELPEAALTLSGGAITCVELRELWNRFGHDNMHVIDGLAETLVACKAMGPRLPRLWIKDVAVYDVAPVATDALVELIRRSDVVEVGEVELYSKATPSALRATLRIFGTWPQYFVPRLDTGEYAVRLCRLRSAGAGTAILMPAAEPLELDRQGRQVDGDDLLDDLLRCLEPSLAGSPRQTSDNSGRNEGNGSGGVKADGSDDGVGGEGDADGDRGDGDDDDEDGDGFYDNDDIYTMGALLLRGGRVDELSSVEPTARSEEFDAWLQGLAMEAVKQAGWSDGCNFTFTSLHGSYTLLPRGHGVLVCFWRPENAAALESVLLAAVEGQQPSGAAAAAGSALQALRVPEECYSWKEICRSYVITALGGAARRLIRQLWRDCDRGIAAAGLGGVEERLVCLGRIAAFCNTYERLASESERGLLEDTSA